MSFQKILTTLMAAGIFNLGISSLCSAAGLKKLKDHSQIKTSYNDAMKNDMVYIGHYVANLERLRPQGGKIDWDEISTNTLAIMMTFVNLYKIDKENTYQDPLLLLKPEILELNDKSQKHDPSFFHSLDRINNSCFNCHEARYDPSLDFSKQKAGP